MKKIVYNLFIIISLTFCSFSFVSCSAITAQNINTDSFSGINGGPMMGGRPPGMNDVPGPGMNGNPPMEDTQGTDGKSRKDNNPEFNNDTMNNNPMKKSDLIGKIESVDGNSITIALIDQNNTNINSNGNSEFNYTGTFKTLTISDDATISEQSNMRRKNQNETSESSLKVSDLKKNQMIMVWYKENTETIEKISIIKS